MSENMNSNEEVVEKPVKQKKNKKVWMGVIAAAVLIGGIAGGSYAYVKANTVGSVDGERITKNELYDNLVQTNGDAALNNLVIERVIEKEAEKKKVEVSDKEIDEQVKAFEEQFGGKEGLKNTLKARGFTLDGLKKDIVTNIKIEKLMEKDIKLSDAEVKKFFEENKELFGESDQVKTRHILVADEKQAQEIKKKLDAGEDFAKLAKENSTDPGSAAKGGDLGYLSKGETVPEFEAAAFALKVNEISAPVQSEHGYHIIKVEDKKEAKPAEFEDHKEEAKQAMLDQKIQNDYATWIEELKGKYEIKSSL